MWCESTEECETKGTKHYWTYIEKDGGRKEVQPELIRTIRSHYDQLERIASDVSRLGYEAAGEILMSLMPQIATARSGDLGEILATELVEEKIGLCVPVRRLRYKDGRNMAMRGDDFIGAGDINGELSLLKGEAKSYKSLDRSTVVSARNVLNRDNGRCTPESLLFVANRLLESSDSKEKALGRRLRDEVGLKSLGSNHISHMLFTISGNPPHSSLREDFNAATTNHPQYVVNIHIKDHQSFITQIYTEAQDLGNQ